MDLYEILVAMYLDLKNKKTLTKCYFLFSCSDLYTKIIFLLFPLTDYLF